MVDDASGAVGDGADDLVALGRKVGRLEEVQLAMNARGAAGDDQLAVLVDPALAAEEVVDAGRHLVPAVVVVEAGQTHVHRPCTTSPSHVDVDKDYHGRRRRHSPNGWNSIDLPQNLVLMRMSCQNSKLADVAWQTLTGGWWLTCANQTRRLNQLQSRTNEGKLGHPLASTVLNSTWAFPRASIRSTVLKKGSYWLSTSFEGLLH